MRHAIILAILGCLAAPLTSHAQLFVSGGISFPVSPESVRDVYKTGFGGTAGFALDIPLIPITPRVWVNFDNFSVDEDEAIIEIEGGDLRAITVGADAQFVAPMGPLSPYFAPAAGFTFISIQDIETGGINIGVADSETALTLGIGAGVALDLLVGPELFLDAKLLYAFTSGDNLMWAPIRLGVVFGL